jgi:hypothetical protein
MKEIKNAREPGFQWTPLTAGGYLTIYRLKGTEVIILE